MRFDRLLVAIDFAPTSLMALRRAALFAGEKATIRLLHAIDLDTPGETRERIEERAIEELKALARPLRHKGISAEVEVRNGRPADEIVAAAARARSDLIVVGSHAQTMIGRELLGSTAEEVARKSPIPVLVVREEAEGGPYVQRVVVAVDGSEASIEAAKAALDLSRRLSAPFVAVHAIDLPLAARIAGTPYARDDVPKDVAGAVGVSIEKDLSAALGRPTSVRILAGDAAAEIARFAGAGDVLVCATRGRNALERIAFGSVATALLRKAPCPILIVRPTAAKVLA